MLQCTDGQDHCSAFREAGTAAAAPAASWRAGMSARSWLRCSLPAEDLGSSVTIAMSEGTAAGLSCSLHHCVNSCAVCACGAVLAWSRSSTNACRR